MEEFVRWGDLPGGDESAWRAFYRSYAPLLKRILSWPRWRFSREEQEDVLQEVFISLMQAVKNYKGEAKLSTFVARIAQNNCVSAIRKKMTHKRGDGKTTAPLDAVEGFHPSGQPPILDALIEAEEEKRVKACFARLEPECRKLLDLRYFEEKTFQEISDACGQPLGTIVSRIKRCLEHLKLLLESPARQEERA